MAKDDTHGKAKRGDHEGFGNVSGKSLLYSDEALATADKLLGGTKFDAPGQTPQKPSLEEQIKQKLMMAGLQEDQAQAVAGGIRECIDGIRQNGGGNTKAVRSVQVFLDGTGVDKKVEQAVCLTCLENLKPQSVAPQPGPDERNSAPSRETRTEANRNPGRQR